MRPIKIAINDLLRLTRDKEVLAFMFLLPLIFTLVMNLAFANIDDFVKDERTIIGIADDDKSDLTSEFINILGKDSMIKLKVLEEDEMNKQISEGIITVGFHLPSGLEKNINITRSSDIRIMSESKNQKYYTALEKIKDAFYILYLKEKKHITFYNKEGNERIPINDSDVNKIIDQEDRIGININGNHIIGQKFNFKKRGLLGYIALFVMNAVVFGARVLLKEKETGTWQRLLVSPAGLFSVLTGKVLGIFLKSWIQCLFLFIFFKLFMGFQFKEVILSFLILNVYICCTISIMMFVSSISKTDSQYKHITNLIVLATSTLSGCWWPIEIVPDVIQKTALLLPPFWMIKGLSNSMLYGKGMSAAVLPLAVMTGMCVLFIVFTFIHNKYVSLKIY